MLCLNYQHILRMDVELHASVELESIQKMTSTIGPLTTNLIDLSRHIAIDLSGWQLVGNPKKLRTCLRK